MEPVKSLKSRFRKLTLSAVMVASIMMATPALMGAFSKPNAIPAYNVACASEEEGGGNGSCCPFSAICGLNGQNYTGYHFVDGSCPGPSLN